MINNNQNLESLLNQTSEIDLILSGKNETGGIEVWKIEDRIDNLNNYLSNLTEKGEQLNSYEWNTINNFFEKQNEKYFKGSEDGFSFSENNLNTSITEYQKSIRDKIAKIDLKYLSSSSESKKISSELTEILSGTKKGYFHWNDRINGVKEYLKNNDVDVGTKKYILDFVESKLSKKDSDANNINSKYNIFKDWMVDFDSKLSVMSNKLSDSPVQEKEIIELTADMIVKPEYEEIIELTADMIVKPKKTIDNFFGQIKINCTMKERLITLNGYDLNGFRSLYNVKQKNQPDFEENSEQVFNQLLPYKNNRIFLFRKCELLKEDGYDIPDEYLGIQKSKSLGEKISGLFTYFSRKKKEKQKELKKFNAFASEIREKYPSKKGRYSWQNGFEAFLSTYRKSDQKAIKTSEFVRDNVFSLFKRLYNEADNGQKAAEIVTLHKNVYDDTPVPKTFKFSYF
jgi:hypothetical protein